MDIQAFIAKRRDKEPHGEQELFDFAFGVANGHIPDYQISAWLMAAYLNPLTSQDTAWLTLGMAASGERLDLAGLAKPWLDKHSTGGVGDKTTLVLLPLLAACGLTMVKMSGRGLGITGGTLDKLASVPGFRLDLSPTEMVAQAGKIGLALTGQSPKLAPADKVLYALRDATRTVASIPLIVSSILSKKLAGGADTILLDVKCGSGAFMPDLPSALRLAEALEETGELCGKHTRAVITDMSQPLGGAVGNALEVLEAIKVLRNEAKSGPERRFEQLCVALANHALREVGKPENSEDILRSGNALEKAEAWFRAQGATQFGPTLEPLATTNLVADSDGFVASIDAGEVGQLVLSMGGGRVAKEDAIDLQVGVTVLKAVGEPANKGEPIVTIHHRELLGSLPRLFEVSTHPVTPPPIFLKS